MGGMCVSLPEKKGYVTVFAPTSGKVVPLKQVGLSGHGVAVLREIPEVIAPVDGEVRDVSRISSSIDMFSDHPKRVNLSIQVGRLSAGSPVCNFYVEQGFQVKRGQKLADAPPVTLSASGGSLEYVAVLVRGMDGAECIPTTAKRVEAGDFLMYARDIVDDDAIEDDDSLLDTVETGFDIIELLWEIPRFIFRMVSWVFRAVWWLIKLPFKILGAFLD
jgi:phosphotransferase system IIA component